VTRRPIRFRQFTINDTSIATGASRLTDLGALVQARWGEDLLGCKIAMQGNANILPSVAGVQSYTAAVFVGADTIDAADYLPATVDMDQTYAAYRRIVHRGQAHQLTAADQFDDINFRLRSPARYIKDRSTTLWLVEETVGQAQSAIWKMDFTVWLP